MKAVVTGATGFIGSAVVRRLLRRGREVRCYVEPGAPRRNLAGLDVEIVEGDVNDRDAVTALLKGADTLFHLAAIYAIWVPDPVTIYKVNVEGTKTVLWAAYQADLERVVFTSSIAAVGRAKGGGLADETCQFDRTDWDEGNAYVRSKWLSERDALRFAAEGLPLVVVNPAFPFGERDIGPTPTGGFIVSALRGQVFGFPDSGFCAVDVEDVAEAHVLAAERGRVGERYILGEHNIGYRDFFRMVGEVAGMRVSPVRLPRWFSLAVGWVLETWADRVSHRPPLAAYKAAKFAARTHFYDCSKAHRELGMPTTPLRDTLERAVRWFRENGYAS